MVATEATVVITKLKVRTLRFIVAIYSSKSRSGLVWAQVKLDRVESEGLGSIE